MKATLMNCSIITADGDYEARTISLDEARELVAAATMIESAIGHESIAQIMTELLGIPVSVAYRFSVIYRSTVILPSGSICSTVNRIKHQQENGEITLVFQLNGRPPEGKTLSRKEIDKIGYSWRRITRVK